MLTPDEIEHIPSEFYEDVDRLKIGGRYQSDMAGALIGAFDGTRIVGIWGAVVQVHCGPLWVSREHRGKSSELRRGMWEKVAETIREWGGKYAYMFAMDDAPSVRHIINRMPHREVQGRAFLMEV